MRCGDALWTRFSGTTVLAGLCLVVFPLLLAATGCSPPTGVVPVKGKVTYKDKPVSSGRITFEPIKLADTTAPKRPSMAPLQADGSFVMSTFERGDGVQPGEYKVIVWSVENEPGDDDWGNIGTTFHLGWLIPEKYGYSKSTPLTITIPADGNVHFDLAD